MADKRRTFANTACPYCSVELDPLPNAKRSSALVWAADPRPSGTRGLADLLAVGDLPVLEQAWAEFREAEARRG